VKNSPAQKGVQVFASLLSVIVLLSAISCIKAGVPSITSGQGFISQGPATFIIAATDSHGQEKADFKCDGLNDEEEINMAINQLDKNIGGRIVLLEGTYYISHPIIIIKPCAIYGVGGLYGWYAPQVTSQSRLFLTDGANCNMITFDADYELMGVTISTLFIDGNRDKQTQASNGIYVEKNINSLFLDNLTIARMKGRGIEFNAIKTFFDVWINRVAIEDNDEECVYLKTNTSQLGNFRFSDCYFATSLRGIALIGGSYLPENNIRDIQINDCFFTSLKEEAIYFTGSGVRGVLFSDNLIRGRSEPTSFDVIHIDGSGEIVISGGMINDLYNTYRYGIYLDNCEQVTIGGGLQIENLRQGAIYLNNSRYVVADGLIMRNNCNAASNVFNVVTLSGSSNYNKFHNCLVVEDAGNKAKYGFYETLGNSSFNSYSGNTVIGCMEGKSN
jgi:hypothetical protein